MTLRTTRSLLVASVLALGLAACGGTTDDGTTDPTGDPSAEQTDTGALPPADGDTSAPVTSSMCAQDEPDCEDTMVDPAGSSCLAGDEDCTDESFDGQDVTRPVLLADASSGADAIADGTSSGATGQVVSNAFLVDDTTLELTFDGGACDVLEDVLVTESESEVRVLVLAGQDAGTDMCTEQIVTWTTTVQLDAPLGDRTLLDLAG